MNLEDIEKFVVPQNIVEGTEVRLREAGRQGYEAFALWTGTGERNEFTVSTLHVPQQTGFKMRRGVCVRVEGSELHRLNRWLFENEEILAVQIHTHPQEAYHSETDDDYPIVTLLGGLSIVVPDFCQYGMFCRRTAVYRLTDQRWEELALPESQRLIQVVL